MTTSPNATSPVDEPAIRAYRLGRVRARLAAADLAGIVLIDPINIRYASGSRNMQVWTMHNVCRYLFVAADGPAVLFELSSGAHLARHLETIDEIRPALSWDFMVTGTRNRELAGRWADDIADLVQAHGGGNRRLAIDRADLLIVEALTARQVALEDGKGVMELARSIKSPGEIAAMTAALGACAESIAAMREAMRPGIRECDLLAILAKENSGRGGEYMETRLLPSGPRRHRAGRNRR